MIMSTVMSRGMSIGMGIIMLDDFIINALLAGFGIAMICGVMGCFVVWRRMAYFGDSLAHSALLGIAIGLATGLSLSLSIFIISMGFALLLLWLQHRGVLATDTLLGILAHGALSFGMVLMALLGIPVDLHAVLFGDILTVTIKDLGLIAAGAVLVLSLMGLFWGQFILMTMSQDLAKAEGVKTFALQMLFLVLMTITVAVSVQMVGVLLITSMLIIPAATARQLVHSPEYMAIGAVIIGFIAVVGGMALSLVMNTPTGPSMVSCLAGLFALVMLATSLTRH
jgi:zinc transport system permease protein